MIKVVAKKAKDQLVKHKHINWALADQAMVSGSNFLTTILLARILGIKEFGTFSLAMLVILFANMVQQSAIIAPMMSIGPKQKKKDMPEYYGSVFVQAFIFAILSFILAFMGIKIISVYVDNVVISSLALPLSINVLLVQMQDFIRRYFYTSEKPGFSFATDFIRYIGFIAILVVIHWGIEKEINAEYTFWISSFITLFAILFFVGNFLQLYFSREIFKKYLKRHWSFSKWLTASAFLQWFSGNVYTIVAGVLIGPASVGALKAAQSLIGVTHIVFLALENIVPIKAAKLYHERKIVKMRKYLTNTAIISVVFVLLVSAIFAIYPDFWFALLFGEEFIPYSYLVRWVCIVYLLMAILLPIRFALRAIENTKVLFYAYFLISILLTVSAVWVIKTLGILGVPLATIASQGMLIVIILFYFRKIIFSKRIKKSLGNI